MEPGRRRPRTGARAGATHSPGPSAGRGRRTTRRAWGRGLSKTRPFVEGHRGPQPPPTHARRRAGGGRGPVVRTRGRALSGPGRGLNKRGVLLKGPGTRPPTPARRSAARPRVRARCAGQVLVWGPKTTGGQRATNPPEAARAGQGTACAARDTPEIVVTVRDNPGGDLCCCVVPWEWQF